MKGSSIMKYSKSSVAVAVSCALASGMASAVTMDSTYTPQGKVDLSDYDNVLIVNVNKGTALSSSQPFELGIARKISVSFGYNCAKTSASV